MATRAKGEFAMSRSGAHAAGCGAVLAACLVAMPAAAQGVTGTGLGAAAPGHFAVGLDLGVEAVQFSRLSWGESFASFLPGSITTGPILDGRPTRGTGMPEISVAWGMPNGLLGYQAELYGRFTYLSANAAQSAQVTSTDITALQSVFQFVAPLDFSALGGSRTQSGFNALGGGTIAAERSQTSYDGWIGARVHIQRGRWWFSPMLEIGYQRLDQEDSMSQTGAPAPFSANSLINVNQLGSDYYRVGVGVGIAYAISTSVAAFGILRGSLDVAHHDYTGTSSGFQDGIRGGNFFGGTSDDSTRVSGRGSLRAGLAFIVTPSFIVSLAGNVAYIGSVPYVVYGSNSPLPAGFYERAGPARIATQGQLNSGGSVGVTIRF
jgi:hypothetical protein